MASAFMHLYMDAHIRPMMERKLPERQKSAKKCVDRRAHQMEYILIEMHSYRHAILTS
jgi:hypothetical protein